MKITTFKHTDVSPKGLVKGGGAVEVKGALRVGKGEGCGLENCNCSPGFYISIVGKRTADGVVEGIKVQFKNEKEMHKAIKEACI